MISNIFRSEINRRQEGDLNKTNPLFILVMNNIALESATQPGSFVEDFAKGDALSRKIFADCARYVFDNLLGNAPGQQEMLLSDSPFTSKIRLWSIYVFGLPVDASTALVEEDRTPGSTIISPRRNAVSTMLKYIELDPDIVFLVTRSNTHKRASAYGTTDDDERGGQVAHYDGRTMYHRYFHLIPGMAAIHAEKDASRYGMTPAHEFSHAFSSYTNGFITDLYVDGGREFNRKVGRPIPPAFANYNGHIFDSDGSRDTIGYPPGRNSFHSELVDPTVPALMDDFWLAAGGPMNARHDRLTKTFILDRVAAKVSR